MTEKQKSALVSNSAKPGAAHRVMKRPAFLENWKACFKPWVCWRFSGQRRNLLPRNIWCTWSSHYQFLSNYSSGLHSVFSLVCFHSWYQHLTFGFKPKHRAIQLPDLWIWQGTRAPISSFMLKAIWSHQKATCLYSRNIHLILTRSTHMENQHLAAFRPGEVSNRKQTEKSRGNLKKDQLQ